MKTFLLLIVGALLGIAIVLVFLLSGDREPSTYADASLAALQALREQGDSPLIVGSPEETEALDRFTALFADFSPDNLQANVRKVYADEVFFNDTVKTVETLDELEPYLVHSGAAVDGCTVEIKNLIHDEGDYYLHWVMDIDFKGDAGVSHTVGMTHLRFNAEGRVVYHQDYWDPATGIFEYIPVLGRLVRLVKDRL